MIETAARRPQVTVIIPAYNAERFLPETLASLVAQTFIDWEAIIIDDGSMDGTAALVESWLTRDSRLRLVRQANAGVSTARNVGIEQARGDYIALLDADDRWDPRKLELQVAVQERSQADVVFCAIHLCDQESQPTALGQVVEGEWSGDDFFRKHYNEFFLYPSSAQIRADVLKHHRFDSTFRSCEDFELWLRLAQAGCRFVGMPEPLMYYRQTAEGLSQQGNYLDTVAVFARYLDSPLLPARELFKPFRLHFRNCFTYLGRRRRIDEAPALFDHYRPYDRDGYACRLMTLLRYLLPAYLFWFVCRFAVIPLAWHLERIFERPGNDEPTR